MTLQEAKSIARRLGLTLRHVRSSDYRVNFREGDESTGYYTDNLEDASIPRLRWPANDPFSFLFWRQCDQRQTGCSSLLRLNHRERNDLDFPCRDDAVREIKMRQGFGSATGRDAPVDDCTFPARLLLDGD
jgi:hypothetical protein